MSIPNTPYPMGEEIPGPTEGRSKKQRKPCGQDNQ